jgi:deoxyribose-phosphate aldolase
MLKPEATREELEKLIEEARNYHFASVCVNSVNVARVARRLKGSGVMTCAVVGFPLGAMVSNAKAFETREAIREGANEIDMVMNIGALKSGDYATVLDDIQKVVKAAGGNTVKVILETGALTDEEKVAGCVLSKAGGAHYVKTSTGFGKGGATVEDIELMRKIVGSEMGVKASGGIRDYETAKKMIDAGATRIGASASVAIVKGPSKQPAGAAASQAGKY